MERGELLKRVKSILQETYCERLRGVILYGSEARGTAEPDSDIDLLVLLDGPVDYWPEVRKLIHILYPLVLENDGRPLHATPADIADYEGQVWPLYRSVKQGGVAL